MKRILLCSLVGIGVLLAGLALNVDAKQKDEDSKSAPRPKWEYKTLNCADAGSKELEKLGNEGWELVSVVATTTQWDFGFSTGGDNLKFSEASGASGSMKGYGNCMMYFKRPR